MIAAEREPGRSALLRFGLLFPCLAGALLALATLSPRAAAVRERLADGVAVAAAVVLPAIGYEVRRDGPRGRVLRASDGHGVTIGTECDALTPMLLFLAAVAVSPVAWRRRVLFGLVGVAVLYLLNLARVGHLLWLSQADPDAFRRAHETWWPAGLVLAAAALFLGWAHRQVRSA